MSDISVVIPSYNNGGYLQEALASVLAQTIKPVQVIVVDDGSTDDTADILKAIPQATVITQIHAGAAAARNTGLLQVKGQLVAFLDADDIWTLDKTELQLRMLFENAELDLVFGHMDEFISPEAVGKSQALLRHAVPARCFSTLLARTESVLRVGMFETSYRVGEFIEWYGPARDAGIKDAIVPEIVSHRRVHEHNSGSASRAAQEDYVSILKAAIDRKRRANALHTQTT